MRITQGEWSALKVAVGILADRRDELNKTESMWLDYAINAVDSANDRLTNDNRKQAELMARRRAVDNSVNNIYNDSEIQKGA